MIPNFEKFHEKSALFIHHLHKSAFKTSFSPNLHFVNDALRNDRNFCNTSHKIGRFYAKSARIGGKGCKQRGQALSIMN